MAGESPLYSMPSSGASINPMPITTPTSTGIDWKSIIGMLGNRPQQGMQVPFQSLQGQYGTGAMTQKLPTPAMFPEEQQQQSSAAEIEQWVEFIAKLFA